MTEIDIVPLPKPRMVRSDKWKQRPCVMKYRAYADELRLKCNLIGYELGHVLDLIFILPMPKSWGKKKKVSMDGHYHLQTPDIDNLCKAFMDSLAKNDSFVSVIHVEKRWGYSGKIIIRNHPE